MLNFIKIDEGNISPKIFIAFVKMSETKAVPQNTDFSCGVTQTKTSQKKTTYAIQKERLDVESNIEEIFEDIWKNQTREWLDYVKMMFYVLFLVR